MATSAEQINALIQAGNGWKAAADQMLAERNAQLDAHRAGYEALANDLRSEFYRWVFVDQVNGDDANDGTLESPVKTVQAAGEIQVNGTATVIKLIGDYRFTQREFLRRGYYNVTSQDEANPSTISFAPQIDGADENAPGIQFNEPLSELFFYGVNFHLESVSPHVTRPWSISSRGATAVYFTQCAITVAAGNDRHLLENNGVAILTVKSSTFPAEMAGHWMVGIATGTDSASVPRLLTTLATL